MKNKVRENPLSPSVPDGAVVIGPVLKKARNRKKLSQDELAGILGVTRNTVINWESGRNKPDIDMLIRLCRMLEIAIHDVFPEDSPLSRLEWQIIESVRLLKPETQELVSAMIFAMVEKEQSAYAEKLRDAFKLVSLHAGSLAAGTAGSGSYFVDEPAEPFFLRISDRTAKADAVIRVSGHSMEPVYQNGDYVYFQLADTADAGEDVVVAWAGELYVKRMDNAGGLYSVNADYPFVYDGSGDDIRILGRVLGIVSSADRARPEDMDLLEELFRDELAGFNRESS